MRQNILKLCHGRLRPDIRKRFFTGGVIKHWNRLPKDMVESPSLEVLRKRVAVALGNVVWCWVNSWA